MRKRKRASRPASAPLHSSAIPRSANAEPARGVRAALYVAAAAAIAAAACFVYLRPAAVPDGVASVQDSGYVDGASCVPCHQQIWDAYRHSGMARSFFRPRPDSAVEDYRTKNTILHRASGRRYAMYERGGRYFQRRHETGFDGQETNVLEKEAHFVMGSGNHVRSYLHLSDDGSLLQLPVSWYSDAGGGRWAMSPGYDKIGHPGFSREVDGGCMFCHNAYPERAPSSDEGSAERLFGGKIPEGIDCQRCHGPGRAHLEAVDRGEEVKNIRDAIVNPARLSPERQLEVCMQCHLETTSSPLPHAIRRYGRSVFSYKPGEPLGDYMLHFDHAPGSGREDKLEIAHAAYRLRKSACFRESAGTMTCTTCHDPHGIPREAEVTEHYRRTCRSCHAADFDRSVADGRHAAEQDCLKCHMPKRRTDDVVHAVMTDHYIQRQLPQRDLLAPLEESHEPYIGEVELYYPLPLEEGAERDLYLAMAQVIHKSNLDQGIPQLARAIERHRPEEPGFYLDLAEAYAGRGDHDPAIAMYEEAIRRRPDFQRALRGLAVALRENGRHGESEAVLRRAIENATQDASALKELGLVYVQQNKVHQAIAAFRRVLAIAPEMPEAHSNLAGLLWETGETEQAEVEAREAIRLQPDLAEAHNNLANILAARDRFQEAAYHFEKAIAHNPQHARSRHNYAVTLIRQGKDKEAQAQLEAAVRLDASLADSHLLLGGHAEASGDLVRAEQHYRRSIQAQPQMAPAYLSLGIVMLSQGRSSEAKRSLRNAIDRDPDLFEAHLALGGLLAADRQSEQAEFHLQQAARSTDQSVRQDALDLLRKLRGEI